jgi:hypothetical protein
MLRKFMLMLAAVLLMATGITAAGVHAAAPAGADSWVTPNPSIAANGYNDQWVFWQGTNGGLWEAYKSGSSSSWVGPTSLPQMGTLGSTPTVAVIGLDGTVPYVTWAGENGSLYLAYEPSGGKWVGPCNLGMGPLPVGGRPSIMSDQSGGLTIGWQGGNNALWYAYSTVDNDPTCSNWSGPHSLGDGPLGSVPSLFGPAGGQYLSAVWTGTGAQDLWYTTGGGLYNLYCGPLGSAPAITSFPYPSHYDVFWAGQNQQLWYTQIDNSGLYPVSTCSPGTISSGNPGPSSLTVGPLETAPSVAFNGNDTVSGQTWYIVWMGADNGLWELTLVYEGTYFDATLKEVPGMGPL